MLAVVSPAKKLDASGPCPVDDYTTPRLDRDIHKLADILKGKSKSDLKSLMGISDNLADLNYDRYQGFEKTFTPDNAKPAVLTFQGDTYKGLDAATLAEDDLKYAQDHLRILSGLYGVLRPLDLMQPYRLEMGTKLATDKGEDLYDFWGDKITNACNDDIKAQNHKAVVNLASNEYISAIDPDKLAAPFITCHFKKIKDGKAKVVGILAKKARGMMARYMIENRIEDPEGLKSFNQDGYEFIPEDSNATDFVFVQKS